MTNKCSVNGCKSSSTKPQRRTFPFPEDRQLREKWLKAIERPDLKPTKYSRICQDHFQPEDFEKFHRLDGKLTNIPLTVLKLKPEAVPSVFPWKSALASSSAAQSPPSETGFFNEVFLISSVKSEPEINPKQDVVETNSSNYLLRCRVCESTEELIDISTEKNSHFREKLQQISCLNDDEKEHWLKFICRSCGEKLEDLSKFQKQCEITYKKLLEEIAKRGDSVVKDKRSNESIAEEIPKKQGGQEDYENLNWDDVLNDCPDREYSDSDDSDNWPDDSGVEEVPKFGQKSSVVKEPEQEKQKLTRTSFNCSICNITFKNSYRYSLHQVMHTGKAFECQQCKNSYTNSANLKRHIRTVHEKQLDFICQICDKAFGQSNSLKEHMYVHQEERKFKCDVCDKSYKKPQLLTSHKYSHLPPEERAIYAKKYYVQRPKLQSQKKPRVCNFCGKISYYANQHIEHVRIHTGEKPLKCSYCEKSFANRNAFKSHVMIHTGEKPYTCEICGVTFRQKPHLKGHILIHTGEKPFKCKVCGKDFRDKTNCAIHMRLHTGEKPSHCRFCPEKFKDSKLLKKHCQSVHSQNQDSK